MSEEIIQYLTNKYSSLNKFSVIYIAEKLCKYDEIRDEFLKWVKTGSYDHEEPIDSQGVTAKEIHEIATHLDGVGVYTFMVTLRDEPELAEKIISDGFTIR